MRNEDLPIEPVEYALGPFVNADLNYLTTIRNVFDNGNKINNRFEKGRRNVGRRRDSPQYTRMQHK